MTISYYRPPTNPNEKKMSYGQRRASRRTADAGRQNQKGEPTTRDPLFDLPPDERRRLRRAEEQGRREGERRAGIEEATRQQTEYDATPEHLRRPPNPWRELIELRRPDAHRADVARRIESLRREAKLEDERIDKIMAEKLKRHELESAPEYAKALGHWDRASAAAESEEERCAFANLKGLIEGGGANQYWDQVAPIMTARLEKVQADVIEHAAKQAPLDEEAKALVERQKAAEELLIVENEPAAPLLETN